MKIKVGSRVRWGAIAIEQAPIAAGLEGVVLGPSVGSTEEHPAWLIEVTRTPNSVWKVGQEVWDFESNLTLCVSTVRLVDKGTHYALETVSA